MTKRDGRKLDHKTMEALRMRAVQQVQAGENPEVVIKALGFGRSRIYEWLALYRAGGWDALRSRKSTGRPRRLDGRKLRWIYDAVTLQDPRQFKFPFALWTRGMIAQVIRQQFGLRLSLPSVGRLLAQMGLTCQRPLYRAFEQNPSLVQRWLKKDYPKIRALARQTRATIYFADEAGIRSDYHAGTTWAPRGRTPVVTTTGQRFGLNLLSAVSARGQLRFMVQAGRVNAEVFCAFLRRLMVGAKEPVFLIVDGHSVHRAATVQRCVAGFDGRLRLFYLPPYSPELNPDELVWNDVKAQGVGRDEVRSREELRRRVHGRLRSLSRRPAKLRSFFQHPHTRYAA
jgi:transposase